MTCSTIFELLQRGAAHSPDASAILGLGRPPLSYSGLLEQVTTCMAQLAAHGIERGERVAIVLPNGPEMAAAFLGVACTAVSAPLNPNYRQSEFDFYLSDLQARLLIVQAGVDSPAVEAARNRQIEVIELQPLLDGEAGRFSLGGVRTASEKNPAPAAASDIALVLHTSGTTSRPKMVPLTHANLCASAAAIQDWLALSVADRCLNVMPLFHIHGLVAALLASLAAHASIACTPGFNAVHFFEWMDHFNPTWYTAVPTMHQAILQRAPANAAVIQANPLRFVRSSSSSLPPQVMAELERVFAAPVIEAYGMTEAAHQMASNPLPPFARVPGSVGQAAGPQVAIMAVDGPGLLPPGQPGEIVIRGPNVTHGYLNNEAANTKAFSNGWFRTGDQGRMDVEGYIYVTGRLKEIINRGGEKISPREIDEVLLDHPAVAQALAFAMPHATLGEEVAAAVVLKNGESVSELDLRRFAAQSLADFKVPRRVLILDEIPKGPTGKLQRIGLAEKLNLTAEEVHAPTVDEIVPPRTPVEERLATIWKDILGLQQVGVTQRFLDLGGDSILALALAGRVNQEFQVQIALLDLFEATTISEQADLIGS
jgi:acyl-CoA synthetase (AMP-forming)/AMP-acid ligase II/acyl carrier protein